MKRLKHVWQQSVVVDLEGFGRVNGVRADFVYVLFMHGYSIKDLSTDLAKEIPTRSIEDAIRFGFWLQGRDRACGHCLEGLAHVCKGKRRFCGSPTKGNEQ